MTLSTNLLFVDSFDLTSGDFIFMSRVTLYLGESDINDDENDGDIV